MVVRAVSWRCVCAAVMLGLALLPEPVQATPAPGCAIMNLGALRGATQTVATSINDRGQIVGQSDGRGIVGHAVLWAGGTLTDLGAFARWQA